MTTPLRRIAPPLPRLGPARHLVERNYLLFRRGWIVLVSGFFEPLFYLLSIGVGISQLVGDVPGPDGPPVPYTLFIAPAMLASSAMNGAVLETTFNVFFKLRYAKVYRPGHAALPPRHRRWRRDMGTVPRRAVLRDVPRRHARHGADPLVVGAAGPTGRGPRGVRVRRGGDGRHHLHAQLAGLRARQPGDAADVPVLGDVLPVVELPAGAAVGRRGDAALPRCGAAARPGDGSGDGRPRRPRGLPARHG